MSWKVSWRARHCRIIPIIASLGIDLDDALDRLEALANLPPRAWLGHPEAQVLAELQIAAAETIEAANRWAMDDDPDQPRPQAHGTVGEPQSSTRPNVVDPDECRCDGCCLRRLKYRRKR